MFLPRRLVQNNISSFSAHQHFSDRLLGSPDLVIEILSEGNNKADVDEKFNIYEDAGITEYWIVHPIEQTIIVYTLQNNKYIGSKPYTTGETIQSRVLPGLTFEVAEVFGS